MRNVSEPPIITRLEVIDENGRVISLRDLTELKYDVQDEGRTLKIFVKGGIMTKEELIEGLKQIREDFGDDPEVMHGNADQLLLEFCGPEVEAAYWSIFNGTWWATA